MNSVVRIGKICFIDYRIVDSERFKEAIIFQVKSVINSPTILLLVIITLHSCKCVIINLKCVIAIWSNMIFISSIILRMKYTYNIENKI